jgi:septal ring-binding cell division protein DamX
MDITIKKIRGIIVINLIIIGLAACSSTPAPWVQVEDSSLDTKQADEEKNVPAEAVISDTSLNDPVLLADPEPEPIIMEEPVAAPVPEMIVPVVLEEDKPEPQTPEQEIMALSGSSYAVQVYAGKTLESIEKFKNSNNLAELKSVKTDRSGSIVYVLVDIYPDRSSAQAAAADLEIKTGSKPWVRSVAGLQKIIAQ